MKKAKIKLRELETNFYIYDQNNSGGHMYSDDKLCHRVIIEADSVDEANEKAEALGIYWNGCDDNIDCSCCGDRWYPATEAMNLKWDATKSFDSVEDYVQNLVNYYPYFKGTEVEARIYYKDGRVKEYR